MIAYFKMKLMLCALGREDCSVEKIITFIVAHWRAIADVCAALFCLVVFLCRKKPVKVIDTIYQELTKLILTGINEAEEDHGAGNGENKKLQVIELVKTWLSIKHPEVDAKTYLTFASAMIEEILSTPQKKGEK